MNQPTNITNIFSTEFGDLHSILSKELGDTTALAYTKSLYKKTNGSVRKCGEIFFDIGKAWSPLLYHWVEWIQDNQKYSPKVIMRDGKVLDPIHSTRSWGRIWLNRLNCGIEDELSNHASTYEDSLLSKYIEQEGLNDPFTFIDSGCWGTIVKDLHSKFKLQFQPLFFFSHNPYIPGFLNDIGINDKEGEILNDSLECCFLNFHERPSVFKKDSMGKISPEIQLIQNPVAKICAQSALEGIKEGNESNKKLSANEAIEILLNLSHKAREEFTGLLHTHSPTWSKGEAFIESWPKELNWTGYITPPSKK